MTKSLAYLMTLMVSVSLTAIAGEPEPKEAESFSFQGFVKAMHILAAEDNGYDPNDGSSYLLKLKVVSPDWNGLRVALASYTAGDLFDLTDFETERVARGMFVTDDGSEKTLLGEAYLEYKGDSWSAKVGRQPLDTPMTRTAYSTMPNLYTAAVVSTQALTDWSLTAAQITQMSFGARSMTDFGLIGEVTGTAGATFRPATLGQAEFHDISKAALGPDADDTAGITALNVRYQGFGPVTLSLWDYYAYDISNTLLVEANAKFPLGSGLTLKLDAQYLDQSDVGDSLAGDLDFSMAGLRATLGTKKLTGFAAYNGSSGDTGLFNAWGGEPGYTSSIFSRNQYRESVDAYRIGAKWTPRKGLSFIAAYANYGQSDSTGAQPGVGQGLTAQTDAEELDLVVVYKPTKAWMLKAFYADRTSEYDGSNGKDLTQSHLRLIASYKF